MWNFPNIVRRMVTYFWTCNRNDQYPRINRWYCGELEGQKGNRISTVGV
jgi:hypothetical protein